MKEYVCVVCKESVSRPKSFAFGTGRACRHHQEVADSAAVRISQQRQTEPKPAAVPPWRNQEQDRTPRLECKCFSCKSRAVKKQEWAQAMLLSMARAKANDERTNVLDHNDPVHQRVRAAFGITAENPAVIVDTYDVSGFSPAKKVALVRGNRDLKMVVDFTNLALLCEPCAKQFGLVQSPAHTVEQLIQLAPAAEMLIDDIAAQMQ